MVRLVFIAVLIAVPLAAQQPFYNDDAGTTSKGVLHFEFFNEFDALQHDLYPSIPQNTASMKLNYGLTDTVELDLDNPYLAIIRSKLNEPRNFNGVGDTNMGVKWNFHKESPDSRLPALSTSFYCGFPTGDTSRQLGSGLIDYWLNGIVQKSISERTKITGNLGILFAGNTSTGLIGIQTGGRVYTFGASVVRKFTERLSLGVEFTAAHTTNLGLSKSQLQFLGGGSYELRKGVGLDFGVLGGRYVASPIVGALGVCRNEAVFDQESITYRPCNVRKLLILRSRNSISDRLLVAISVDSPPSPAPNRSRSAPVRRVDTLGACAPRYWACSSQLSCVLHLRVNSTSLPARAIWNG